MDAYVSKPIRIDDFMAAITMLTPAPQVTEPEDQFLDTQDLMTRFDGDLELLHQAYDLFRQSYPKLLTELRDAIMRTDAETVQRAAHTLKGSVGNFGGLAAVKVRS
jgi:HPt (histidine-containing phosphotransfer) domain-containing protein